MLKEIGCGFVQPRGLIVLHSKEGNSYPIFRKSGISNIMCCSRLFHVLAMKAAEYRVRNKENKFGEKAIPKPLKTTRWTKTGSEATANIIWRWWVCLTNYISNPKRFPYSTLIVFISRRLPMKHERSRGMDLMSVLLTFPPTFFCARNGYYLNLRQDWLSLLDSLFSLSTINKVKCIGKIQRKQTKRPQITEKGF